MKKIFCPVFCFFTLFLVGCTPSTEFDEKAVTEIIVETTEGMADVFYRNTRTFDFLAGTVTDDCVTDVKSLVDEFRLNYERYIDPFQSSVPCCRIYRRTERDLA